MLDLHTVLPNKFWIIKDSDKSIGSLRTSDCNTFEYYNTATAETIQIDIDYINEHFNIVDKSDDISENAIIDGLLTNCVNPIDSALVDGIQTYRKSVDSTIVFAAGFFAVRNPKSGWTVRRCPKIITLLDNEYLGPFRIEADATLAVNRNNSTRRK
jgi:hypothetical protein